MSQVGAIFLSLPSNVQDLILEKVDNKTVATVARLNKAYHKVAERQWTSRAKALSGDHRFNGAGLPKLRSILERDFNGLREGRDLCCEGFKKAPGPAVEAVQLSSAPNQVAMAHSGSGWATYDVHTLEQLQTFPCQKGASAMGVKEVVQNDKVSLILQGHRHAGEQSTGFIRMVSLDGMEVGSFQLEEGVHIQFTEVVGSAEAPSVVIGASDGTLRFVNLRSFEQEKSIALPKSAGVRRAFKVDDPKAGQRLFIECALGDRNYSLAEIHLDATDRAEAPPFMHEGAKGYGVCLREGELLIAALGLGNISFWWDEVEGEPDRDYTPEHLVRSSMNLSDWEALQMVERSDGTLLIGGGIKGDMGALWWPAGGEPESDPTTIVHEYEKMIDRCFTGAGSILPLQFGSAGYLLVNHERPPRRLTSLQGVSQKIERRRARETNLTRLVWHSVSLGVAYLMWRLTGSSRGLIKWPVRVVGGIAAVAGIAILEISLGLQKHGATAPGTWGDVRGRHPR